MTTYRRSSEVSPPPRHQREVISTGFDIPRAGGVVARRDYPPEYPPSPFQSKTEYPPSPFQSKTEYVVRARTLSSVESERQTPPSHSQPHDPPRSPLTRRYYHPESGSYIQPAVSSLRGQVNTVPTASTHVPHVQRDHRNQNGNRIASSAVGPASGTLVQYDGEGDYSYTNPHEQFNHDYPPRDNWSRPAVTTDFVNRKATSRSKESGPPPAVRQFRIGGEGSRPVTRRFTNLSDDEAKAKRSHSMRRLYQDGEEMHSSRRSKGPARETNSSHREKGHAAVSPRDQSITDDNVPNYTSDIEHDRDDYHRHPRRFPQDSRDRLGKFHGIAAAGLGGLAAAGLTSVIARRPREKNDTDRDDPGEFQDRKNVRSSHKTAEAGRARDRTAELREEDGMRRQHGEKVKKERSDSDSIDSHTEGRQHGSKHRHRRRHHSRHRKPSELESGMAINDQTEGEGPEVVDRDWHERGSAQEGFDPPRRVRRYPHDHKRRPSEDGKYAGAPTDGEEGEDSDGSEEGEESEEGGDQGDRTPRLQLVEPPKEKKEPQLKPKGILKPPREKPFPEYPNPEREGVAPLKEKKGIPPGAKWTKINRVLVNPEALEAHHKRYVERPDYIIVLQVLSWEEIQDLAETTNQIRAARALQSQERQRSEGGDDIRKPPLAIEAPPPDPTTDPRFQQTFPSQVNSWPEQDTAVVAGLGIRAQ